MVEISVAYEGQLRCEATHGPSGNILITDAPVDNHGKGESFSPTDLVASALGTCMLTTMGIAAQKLNVDILNAHMTVKKEMVADPKRRIGQLIVHCTVEAKVDDVQRAQLVAAAEGCPVTKSLHPETKVTVAWQWR